MVGPWVTEQLGQAYLAVNWEATVDEVAHFIQPHPSLSELFGESVLAMTRPQPARLSGRRRTTDTNGPTRPHSAGAAPATERRHARRDHAPAR